MCKTLPIDRELFDILVCPIAKTPLKWVQGALVSTDAASRRRYRVDQGIPIMLIEESEQLSPDAWEALMAEDGPIGRGPAAVLGE